MEIYRAKQRFTDNLLVTDGQFSEDRKTFICAPLVFHRTTDSHILVPIAPILWQTLGDTFWSLRNHVKKEVTPSFYHQPSIFSPTVRFFDEEI
jgi:hypothetical protein